MTCSLRTVNRPFLSFAVCTEHADRQTVTLTLAMEREIIRIGTLWSKQLNGTVLQLVCVFRPLRESDSAYRETIWTREDARNENAGSYKII